MGHRPCMPDSVPVIGPAPRQPGLWLAVGHGHLGLTDSINTAVRIAEAMLGRPASIRDLERSSHAIHLRRPRARRHRCSPRRATLCAAQSWPDKPVHFVVPFPAGGSTDVVGRLIADRLAAKPEAAVRDREPGGAGGTLGSDCVAKAPPDGYTVLLGTSSTHAIAPSLYSKLPYNPARDFVPVTLIGKATILLVVNPSVPAQSVRELIALAKAKPGRADVRLERQRQHLAPHRRLLRVAGRHRRCSHIPYKGDTPMITDIVAGRVSMAFGTAVAFLPQVKAGKLEALAVDRRAAFADRARAADRGRRRLARLRGPAMVRRCSFRPERRRTIVARLQTETDRILQSARRARAAADARHRGRGLVGAVRRLHAGGDREVGEDRSRLGGEGRLASASPEKAMPKTPIAKKTSTSSRKTSTRKTSSAKASTHKASSQKASTAKVGSRFVVPGTERRALPGARAAAPVLPDERIEVSVRVRPKPGARDLDAGGALADQAPAERRYLSRDEFAAAPRRRRRPTSPRSRRSPRRTGSRSCESSAARRSVVLSGTAAAMSDAFGVKLEQFEHDGGTYRGRTGAVSVPGDLAGIVEGVFGLDNRPQADAALPACSAAPRRRARTRRRASFTPPQLAALYDFPAGADGSGQCIGIIELGGGFKPADLTAYFAGLGSPVPDGEAVSVDGAQEPPDRRRTAPTAR